MVGHSFMQPSFQLLLLFQAQVRICNPVDRECFKNLTSASSGCTTKPCQGLYADINHKADNTTVVRETQWFKRVFKEYEEYRKSYKNPFPDRAFPDNLTGNSCCHSDLLSIFDNSDYNQKPLKLHYVNIYFSSPTYDIITKDLKTNFETKLSTIGGTMGLFTGLSILSGIEIIYFIIKTFLNRILKKSTV